MHCTFPVGNCCKRFKDKKLWIFDFEPGSTEIVIELEQGEEACECTGKYWMFTSFLSFLFYSSSLCDNEWSNRQHGWNMGKKPFSVLTRTCFQRSGADLNCVQSRRCSNLKLVSFTQLLFWRYVHWWGTCTSRGRMSGNTENVLRECCFKRKLWQKTCFVYVRIE